MAGALPACRGARLPTVLAEVKQDYLVAEETFTIFAKP
jgi:hypothetical protein